MKSMKIAVVILAVLVLSGGIMLWLLTRSDEQPVSRIVAKRDLRAFTLLTAADLEVTRGSSSAGQSAPKTDHFTKRYLLAAVTRGTEITPEMVSDPETTSWLARAVAISVTASAATTLRGQLQAGDWVSLIAVSTKDSADVKKFTN